MKIYEWICKISAIVRIVVMIFWFDMCGLRLATTKNNFVMKKEVLGNEKLHLDV